MIGILVDHNIEGQAALLWSILHSEGWLELIPIRLLYFKDVGLMNTSSDREIWHVVQKKKLLLLTANRNMQGKDSLEQTIREENHSNALPVLTLSNADRVIEADYRLRYVTRMAEVALYIDDYLGVGRLFIP